MRQVSRRLLQSLLLVTMAGGVVSCSDDNNENDTPAPTQPGSGEATATSLTLTQTVVADSRFSTLRAALTEAGLLSVLESGDFTVFAPTNEAFAKLPAGALESLLADREQLRAVLLYHVVGGRLAASDVLSRASLESANGQALLQVSTRDQGAFINDSRILQTDIRARNGIIHVIDTVLLPPKSDDGQAPTPAPSLVELLGGEQFSTLRTAVIEAGLVDTLQGGVFTVSAPTNEAFAKLPEGTVDALLTNKQALTDLLLYHVLPGRVPASEVLGKSSLQPANPAAALTVSVREQGAFINESRIIATDIQASNGIVHVIDSVLLLPTPAPAPSLVELLADEQFSTLRTAVVAAGLVDTLQSGTFTVFAPTNAAFAALPPGTVEALLNDKQALTNILLYHVLPGRVLAADVLSKSSLQPANPTASLSVSLREQGAFVNESRIIATDIQASNGVVHVIDAVLIP